jgi:dihydrofolate reductase
VERVKALKSLPGKNLVLWGSITLAQTLMKENLVDEYHLYICPVLTGGGRRLFTEEMKPSALSLSETKYDSSGVVFLRYSAA